MGVQIKSKRAVVSKAPYELYMVFTDMSNFVRFLPEERKADVTADYDSLHATVQGFNIGVRISSRTPYSRIDFADDGAPFKFALSMHFEPASDPYKTDYQIYSRNRYRKRNGSGGRCIFGKAVFKGSKYANVGKCRNHQK